MIPVHVQRLQDNSGTTVQMNLLFRLRIIFRDIATWLRAYMVSTYLNSDPELKLEIMQKLNKLPIKYGDILRIFFGDKAAEEFTLIFLEYFRLLISLIEAQKNGDTAAVDEYTILLDQNVEKRIDFLSQINPFWQKDILTDLLKNYNKLTIDEAKTFLTKDYKKNVDLFDKILNLTSVIGDYIEDGLEKYFTFTSREPNLPK